jgi:hypothetical protein
MSFTPVLIGTYKVANDSPLTPQASGGFGYPAISADGLVMVVGSEGYSNGTKAGGVMTYDWNGSAWVYRNLLLAFDRVLDDYFGISTSLSADGKTLVVGAYLRGATNTGAVYTYYDVGGTWTDATTTKPLVASDAAANDYFGTSAAISGDGLVLAVGAFGRGATDVGAVYVYARSGTAPNYVWTLRTAGPPSVVASDAATNDYFGRGVALDYTGATLVVNAEGWEGVNPSEGGVYTYDWVSASSTYVQRGVVLTSPDHLSSGGLGTALSLSSDANILSASLATYGGTYAGQGAVLIYDRSGSSWVFRLRIEHPTPQAGEGLYVAHLNGSGSVAVIGAPGYDEVQSNQGRVTTWALEEGAMPGGWNNAPSLAKTQASGTGGMYRSMEGAIELPKATADGIGSFALYGTADITLPKVTTTSEALAGTTGLTGASELPAVTATGTGGQYGGAVTLPTVTLAATMSIGLMATAAMQLPRVRASGASTVTVLGAGSIVLPKVVSTSGALLGRLGIGGITLRKVRATGTGSFGVRGLCALVLPKVTSQGAGFQSVLATGSTSMGKIKVKGLVL